MIAFNHRFTNATLCEFKAPTTKEALQLAVKSEADLRWADLRWADLRWADLREADLREAHLREACAKVCEAEAEKWEGDGIPEPMSRICADAIRTRSNAQVVRRGAAGVASERTEG